MNLTQIVRELRNRGDFAAQAYRDAVALQDTRRFRNAEEVPYDIDIYQSGLALCCAGDGHFKGEMEPARGGRIFIRNSGWRLRARGNREGGL
ncbi:MAG: hypothetical protein QOJ99_1946 [Bryobacterales bacterium]|nr:hypothetical protein [Bryobacterales bacterium]